MPTPAIAQVAQLQAEIYDALGVREASSNADLADRWGFVRRQYTTARDDLNAHLKNITEVGWWLVNLWDRVVLYAGERLECVSA